MTNEIVGFEFPGFKFEFDEMSQFIICDFTHESLQNAFHRIYRENLKVQYITVSTKMLKLIIEQMKDKPNRVYTKVFSENDHTLFGYKLVVRDLVGDKIIIFYKKGK